MGLSQLWKKGHLLDSRVRWGGGGLHGHTGASNRTRDHTPRAAALGSSLL